MKTPEIRIQQAKQAHAEVFQQLNISDSDLAGILHGKNHEQKLEWVISRFRPILQPLGFTGSHVSQIVTSADWKEKMEWIEVMFQRSGLTPKEAQKILIKKNWKEVLD